LACLSQMTSSFSLICTKKLHVLRFYNLKVDFYGSINPV
jgi:hypothetical protein